jgi:GNAT superfamily N-acetyltransferase
MWLLEQMRAFGQFFGSKHSLFPSDDGVALETLRVLIEAHVFFVAEKEDGYVAQLVGFIAGALGPHPYNAQIMVLSEQFWWVNPIHRGSSAGARLLERFLQFGREHADWIVMTLETKSPVDPKSLERKGFKHFEHSYLLETG